MQKLVMLMHAALRVRALTLTRSFCSCFTLQFDRGYYSPYFVTDPERMVRACVCVLCLCVCGVSVCGVGGWVRICMCVCVLP